MNGTGQKKSNVFTTDTNDLSARWDKKHNDATRPELQFTSSYQSDIVLFDSDIKQANQEPDIAGALIGEIAFWALMDECEGPWRAHRTAVIKSHGEEKCGVLGEEGSCSGKF